MQHIVICVNNQKEIFPTGKGGHYQKNIIFHQIEKMEEAEIYAWLLNQFLPRDSEVGENERLFFNKLEKEEESCEFCYLGSQRLV